MDSLYRSYSLKGGEKVGLFNWKKEKREKADNESDVSSDILRMLLSDEEVSRRTALNIPALSACINMIADTVSSLKIKLYKKDGDKVEEIVDDIRTTLLNDDTGDTLDASQMKKALIMDMFLSKGGYVYINRVNNEVKSLHYVEPEKISFMYNTDPIFKDYKILVNGASYEGWQFIKILRNTQNGYCGQSIIAETPELLGIILSTQKFEKNLVQTGGNKKGFIQSAIRLSAEAMEALKRAFHNLYSNSTENVVVLNDGLSFKEASNSSVELQLNENKETNNRDICKIFLVPPSIINGGATEEDKKRFYEVCIYPILARFVTAINSVLLQEDEKNVMFFAFDDTDLTKTDIEKRFAAYKVALDSGFMQLDEVRKKERLPEFGLDFIKLGLQDVLYYPESGQVYTPNTDKYTNINDTKKGDETNAD